MKKAITILAIIAIVAGAVFADTSESHKIQIKTQVQGFEPVFQLYFDAATKTNYERAVARTDPNVAEGEDFSNVDDAHAYTTENSAIIDKTDVDISRDPVTATVTAKLTGNVKLGNTKTYTITFKADRLASDETHIVGNAQQAATYYINPTVTGSSVAAANSVPTGITMNNISNPALDGTTLVGSIDAVMSTVNIDPGNLATFTFKYDADQNAPVDYYTAYVWMVVSAS